MTTTSVSYEQLDLFTLAGEPTEATEGTNPATVTAILMSVPSAPASKAAATPKPAPKPKKTAAAPKPALPAELVPTQRTFLPSELGRMLELHGFQGLYPSFTEIPLAADGAQLKVLPTKPHKCLTLNQGNNYFRDKDDGIGYYHHDVKLLYAGPDGICWQRDILFQTRHNLPRQDFRGNISRTSVEVTKLTASPWKPCTRLPYRPSFMQDTVELDCVLQIKNPYAYAYAKANGYPSWMLLAAPQIETLGKAGYRFVEIFRHGNGDNEDTERFNRLTQHGNNPKEIFKTTKEVYSVLKDESELSIWDTFRRMQKFGRVSADSIRQAYYSGMNVRQLELAQSVLSRRFDGSPAFSWEKLIGYLGRVDMFEAINREEALILLNDYLRMCSELGIKPRIDGDSLKREHDVTARICRERRNETVAKKMNAVCGIYSKFDYSEAVYSVRAIRDYDDLVDEACQQTNCVASYAKSITEGTSLIFVMRETAHPDRSLITIELSPKLEMRQKLMSHNRAIRNKSQSEFIERWLKWAKSVK